MTKSEALKTLLLLSALESWLLSVKAGIPEYQKKQLTEVTAILTEIVMEVRR